MKKGYWGASINEEQTRINDDFAFNFDSNGVIDKKVSVVHNFSEINNTNDWSISFFVLKRVSALQAIIDTRIGINNNRGFEIVFDSSNRLIFVTGIDGVSQIDYITPKPLPSNVWLHVVYTYDFATNTIRNYVNNVLEHSFVLRADFTTTLSTTTVFGRLQRLQPSFIQLNGLLREFATFNKVLEIKEIVSIYQELVLPFTALVSCQFHLPFNQIAKINGANRQFRDVSGNYNYLKVTPITPKVCNVIGWNDNELGLNPATSTFTAYADFYTKVLGANFGYSVNGFPTYRGVEIRKYGLSFNGTNQSLTIPNFNPIGPYTILCAYSSPVPILPDSALFSKRVDSTNRIELTITGQTPRQTTDISTALVVETLSNSSVNFCACKSSSGVRIPHEVGGSSNWQQVISINNKKATNTNAYNVIFKSFSDQLGTLTVGARENNTLFFQGTIFYLLFFKRVLNDKEILYYYNNGSFRNSEELSPIQFAELELFLDFNNPFDNAGTLQIPDLTNNYQIIVNGSANLTDLQNRRVEI